MRKTGLKYRHRPSGILGSLFLFVIVFLQPIVGSAERIIVGISDAQDLLSISNIRHHDGGPTVGFVKLILAINKLTPEVDLKIRLYPFDDSYKMLQNGNVDVHLPKIRTQNHPFDNKNYLYSSRPIAQVAFVLYSNADVNEIDMKRMEEYRIATLSGHSSYFNFAIRENLTIASGVRLVSKGKLDGFVMAQEGVDQFLRKSEITNIRRQLFRELDSMFVVRNNERGENIDKILTRALEELEARGELDKLILNIHKPYNDWQPHKK